MKILVAILCLVILSGCQLSRSKENSSAFLITDSVTIKANKIGDDNNSESNGLLTLPRGCIVHIEYVEEVLPQTMVMLTKRRSNE